MKKLLAGILATALVVCMGITSVFAATPTPKRSYCVDENGDDICDYHKTACGYADADGDGVCDNCTSDGTCLKKGNGAGTGHGSRHHSESGHHGGHHGRCGR